MPEEHDNRSREEKLKEENDFLKMKLMLEYGGDFISASPGEELSPELENEFLKNIEEYEKRAAMETYIRIYDKIGRPVHFRPVSEIPRIELDKAWEELLSYLNQYGIDLDVCSPNVPVRELYRFVTEELFEHEICDTDIPGMMTNFIYDEFYPDPVYESERIVEDSLFASIFNEVRIADFFYCIDAQDIGLNRRLYPDGENVIDIFNRFKNGFRTLNLNWVRGLHCTVDNDEKTTVTGEYSAMGKSFHSRGEIIFEDRFSIGLIYNECGFWCVKNILIDGIDFGRKY